jgi:hypothetical protein
LGVVALQSTIEEDVANKKNPSYVNF